MRPLCFKDLGLVPFDQVREIQLELVQARLRGAIEDTILFCEHPATISLGKRTEAKDLFFTENLLKEEDFKVFQSARGGGPTVHMPGQLLIYPVISLRDRRLGVRRFIEAVFQSLLKSLKSELEKSTIVKYSIQYNASKFPGLWCLPVESFATQQQDCFKDHLIKGAEKLGAVGLQIIKGVTNHGFSLNISGDLSLFSQIAPCGYSELKVTSLDKILKPQACSVQDLIKVIKSNLFLRFNSSGGC